VHDSNTEIVPHYVEPIGSRKLTGVLYRERWSALLIALAAHLIAFTVVINTVDMWELAELEVETAIPTLEVGMTDTEAVKSASAEGDDANDDQAAQRATQVTKPEQLPFTPPDFDPNLPGQHAPTSSEQVTKPAEQELSGNFSLSTLGKGKGAAGKAAYGNRGDDHRRDALQRFGGSEKTERAMEDGLNWLASVQQLGGAVDAEHYGAWDARVLDGARLSNDERKALEARDIELPGSSTDEVGLTALVVLAFNGAGYTRTGGVYAKNQRAAIDYLLRHQKDDGYFGSPVRSSRKGNMYDHAITLLALADMYALTGESDLSQPVKRGLEFLLSAQQSNGAWDYAAYDLPKIESRQRFDLSILGFAVMAMMSCKAAGLDVPDAAFEGVARVIREEATAKDGWGIYANIRTGAGRRSATITAVNHFMRLLLGQRRSDEMLELQRAIITDPASVPKYKGDNGDDNNLYSWYYTSLSLMLNGDESEWQAFNVPMKRELLDAQYQERGSRYGSWPPVIESGVDTYGHLRTKRMEWSDPGGRIYTTAMACLCLQVYYRYIPEFLKAEGSEYRDLWD